MSIGTAEERAVLADRAEALGFQYLCDEREITISWKNRLGSYQYVFGTLEGFSEWLDHIEQRERKYIENFYKEYLR